VAEGDYRVKIQGRGKKDLLSYEVVAKIEGGARPRPPANVPRRPRPEPRTQEPAVQRPRVQEPALPRPAPQEVPPTLVEVLEVERENGEPVAVLIDAGTPMGIEAGLRGSLVDNGQQIGRIEIVDVYDSGSRARLIGPLAAPITIDTEAVLRLPLPE
jgi:hypothetical protein